MLRSLLLKTILALVVSTPALGEPLAAPAGEVILTVTGAIVEHNQGDAAVFDLDALRALGEDSFTTTTIWTEGEKTFTGISLLRLMQRLGAEGTQMEARALNDYSINIPMSDAVEGGPILAYEMDGDVMSVRDKGPIWLVYPYDLDNKYQSEIYFSRSIWQLSDIKILD